MKDFILEIQFLDGAVAATMHQDGRPTFLMDEAFVNHGGEKMAAARTVILRAVAAVEGAEPAAVASAVLPKLFREAMAWGATYVDMLTESGQWEKMRDRMAASYTARAALGRSVVAKELSKFIEALEKFEADDGTFVRLADVHGAMSVCLDEAAKLNMVKP